MPLHMIHCPRCRALNSVRRTWCHVCEAELPKLPEEPPAPPLREQRWLGRPLWAWTDDTSDERFLGGLWLFEPVIPVVFWVWALVGEFFLFLVRHPKERKRPSGPVPEHALPAGSRPARTFKRRDVRRRS